MTIALPNRPGLDPAAARARALPDPEQRITAPLLAVLALAPLPFASNRPWSWSFLALALAVILAVWAWTTLRAARPVPVSLGRIWPAVALFGLVCLYAALQALPHVPPALANPLWRLADGIDATAVRRSISIAPEETLTALMRLVTYGAVFFLFLQIGRDQKRASRCIAWIAGIVAAYAAYGLVVHLGGFDTILWFRKWAYPDSLTSTFINRNSFATFLGIGLLCALALMVRPFLRSGPPFALNRRGLADLFGRIEPEAVFGTACLLLILAALFLTRSRAGTAATVIGALVFLGGLGLGAGRRRTPSLVAGGLFAAAAAYYFALSGDGVMDRATGLLAGGLDDEARIHAYADILRAIREHAWLGTGYGSFEDVFKSYRSPAVLAYFDKAHSTYLENALELGVPAATGLAAAVALVAWRCMMSLRRRSSAFVLGWTAFGASVLVGLHAVVDFSLQIPAVAVTYAALLGVGCAQSWSRREAVGGIPRAPHRRRRMAAANDRHVML